MADNPGARSSSGEPKLIDLRVLEITVGQLIDQLIGLSFATSDLEDAATPDLDGILRLSAWIS